MTNPVRLVLVGMGGMGSVYLDELLRHEARSDFRLIGAVDPKPEKCPRLEELRRLGIPIFPSLEEFYRAQDAELAILASPIHLHAPQTCLALDRGSHVLCEKPVAATIQEAIAMLQAEKKAGKRVAVGYQWSFSDAVQKLKKDIQLGIFGRPRRLKCLYLWPRDLAYYRRNDWAGRKKDKVGRWVLDSPAHNAMAHDLHNMLYILGPTRETSARPANVEAELYRAFPIENFDTAALRILTEEGTEILFYVSHASAMDTGPVFDYEFEFGRIETRGRNAPIKARSVKGEIIDYGSPDSQPLKKMWDALDMAKSDTPPACGIEAATSQTLCLNGAQESMPEIVDFPRTLLRHRQEGDKITITVEGLEEALIKAYEKNLLPFELGVSWSKKGKVIDLTNYHYFPSKAQ